MRLLDGPADLDDDGADMDDGNAPSSNESVSLRLLRFGRGGLVLAHGEDGGDRGHRDVSPVTEQEASTSVSTGRAMGEKTGLSLPLAGRLMNILPAPKAESCRS